MKEVKKEGFMTSVKTRRLNVGYSYKGQTVTYAKVAIAVVNNPYTGQVDIAVQPYIKDDYGELAPLYSFEEDIQCQEGFRIAYQCKIDDKPIPDDVDKFMRKMMRLKEKAREQADAYVKQYVKADDISTSYARSVWREDVVSSKEAKELLEEYHRQVKAKKE